MRDCIYLKIVVKTGFQNEDGSIDIPKTLKPQASLYHKNPILTAYTPLLQIN